MNRVDPPRFVLGSSRVGHLSLVSMSVNPRIAWFESSPGRDLGLSLSYKRPFRPMGRFPLCSIVGGIKRNKEIDGFAFQPVMCGWPHTYPERWLDAIVSHATPHFPLRPPRGHDHGPTPTHPEHPRSSPSYTMVPTDQNSAGFWSFAPRRFTC